ncbi:MAG: RecX family transcriptional regulator, partial [Actinomycetales bacterium]|nr:RecX family transcriptional regulator [Actinomycetales bacterium]
KCGVAKELIDQALAELPDDQELEIARTLAAKKLRAMSKLEPEVARRRLLSALARKGYSSAVSLAVIAEVLENPDS